MIEQRTLPPTGILQPWVAALGLRHQGVLISIVRGCDSQPKHCPSKTLTRAIRGLLLNTHSADATKAKSFIEVTSPGEFWVRFQDFIKNGLDHYPLHWVMHLVHALEILGYYHSADSFHGSHAAVCFDAYKTLCRKLHLNPESKAQMNARLDADEDNFARAQ